MTTFKSPVIKATKPMKKKEEDDDHPLLKRKVGRPSKNDIKIRLKLQKEAEEKQAAVTAARAAAVVAVDTSASSSAPQRRKYTKRKKDGTGGGNGGGKHRDFSPFDEEGKKRVVSPLPDRSAAYRPCAMEKRARWWTGEKRRVDISPEREFGTTAADSAAAFRMMAHAVRSAAVTRNSVRVLYRSRMTVICLLNSNNSTNAYYLGPPWRSNALH
uniref:Uncharacterized protein n=1 Tax=Caenorhabditis japonica TaxID=281687 RepID=A0A8R1E6U2_CAEJA